MLVTVPVAVSGPAGAPGSDLTAWPEYPTPTHSLAVGQANAGIASAFGAVALALATNGLDTESAALDPHNHVASRTRTPTASRRAERREQSGTEVMIGQAITLSSGQLARQSPQPVQSTAILRPPSSAVKPTRFRAAVSPAFVAAQGAWSRRPHSRNARKARISQAIAFISGAASKLAIASATKESRRI